MEIATKGQLRWAFLRWAMVTVPAIILLGFGSSQFAPSGDKSAWYRELAKPALNPPGWVFPIAWTALYIMMGLALAMILNARGSRYRGLAIALFVGQMVLNLVWTPVFFGAHLVFAALLILIAMFVVALITTIVFGRIRTGAAWLMVPYLAWLCFAGALNFGIMQLNPNAETLLVPASSDAQMTI
ncbi:tryptophan-rich sensory protein [Sphingomonas panacisoli]|uniref:Tryptophan-rich sensory protein n=1 Tax=Sphingomonas panacisoli TaxID=1813879 RepID=A0A5B8LEV3_9SPHN|nr:TspO/MBR family protein [Sphingomonas panacisoli]QDZ06738.1 tryptophan-rich sensory protein [Sphingomonas panacisoli]